MPYVRLLVKQTVQPPMLKQTAQPLMLKQRDATRNNKATYNAGVNYKGKAV